MAFKWVTRLISKTSGAPERSTDLGRAIAVLMLEVAQSDFKEAEGETSILLAELTKHIGENSHNLSLIHI